MSDSKRASNKRDSSNEVKIVGSNAPEVLLDPTKITTHRKTIFGRGFIELDLSNQATDK